MRYHELTEARHFRRPSHDDVRHEHSEVAHQLAQDQAEPFLRPDVRAHLETLRDPHAFRQAMQSGVVRPVMPDEIAGIDNTGDTWTQEQTFDPDKRRRVEALYRAGSPITMPVVLWNRQTGERHLLGGHHRLSYNAHVRRKATPVLHLPHETEAAPPPK